MVDTQLHPDTSLNTFGKAQGPVIPGHELTPDATKTPTRVPIRSLGGSHRERIAAHLLALDQQDRYLRFGFSVNDEQIRRYTDKLDFDRDDIFGIYNRRLELIAMAHLAFSSNRALKPCAEFGVSVASAARGRGYGARLFDRAAMHSRNEGVSVMFIHALSENAAMLKIARQAGAVIERDGAESEAHLRLLPATLDTRLTELMEEQVARADYRLKWQCKTWGDLFSVSAVPTSAEDDDENSLNHTHVD